MPIKVLSFIIAAVIIILILPIHQASANACYEKFKCMSGISGWQCNDTKQLFSTLDECKSNCTCPRTGRYICSSTHQTFREQDQCEQNCPEGVCEPGGPYEQCVLDKNTDEPKCDKPGLVPCGNAGQPACTICDGFVLAQNIIDFIMIDIIPPLAALMLAIAGVLFLFAGGSQTRRTKARNLLKNAVIGIVIAYASFIIINSVLTFFVPDSAQANHYFSLREGGFRIQCK